MSRTGLGRGPKNADFSSQDFELSGSPFSLFLTEGDVVTCLWESEETVQYTAPQTGWTPFCATKILTGQGGDSITSCWVAIGVLG